MNRNYPHFAIPEIYGETLSYYELLRKLVKAMNVMIENYDTIPDQIAEAVANLDASQLFSAVLNQLIHSIATDNTKSTNAVKVYKKHDLLYATFNETVNLYESLIDFTTGTETELIVGSNIREVNISELFIELRKMIGDESQARVLADKNLQKNIDAVSAAVNENSEEITTINNDITSIENKNNEQDNELSTLTLKVINDYVTPEMYGAVGDGVTDDTNAIQQAVNNSDNLQVYFGNKTYLISESIQLSKFNIVNNGTIRYTGTDYAFVFAPSSYIDGAYSKFGTVLSPNGGILHVDSSNVWIQYLTIDFKDFKAGNSKDCVHIDVVGGNWVNEVRFVNGRFSGGNHGVYIDHSKKTGTWFTSHLTFDLVGFEGVTHGVYLPSMVTRTSFTNCRAEESITDVVYSDATSAKIAQMITWSGSIANGLYWQNCNNYYVLLLSGYINYRGTYIANAPIMLFNGMIHGLDYTNGTSKLITPYGAYSYNAETHIQEIDFAKVFDFNTEDSNLYERPHVRTYTMNSNNTSATETDIYLDDRMFLQDWWKPSNSYLLELVVSPSVVVNIYNKRGGTLLYTLTGESKTTYPRLVITGGHKLYTVQKVDFSRKSV